MVLCCFVLFTGVGTLLPFITLFMKQLGLSSVETGVIYGVMPFVGFIVRPALGAVADKLHQHKLVLMIVCLLTGVFYLCLLLVPANINEDSTKVFTSIHCNNEDSYISDCNNGASCPMSLTHYGNVTVGNGNDSSPRMRGMKCSALCTFAVPGAYSSRVCFTSTVGSFPDNCLNIWVSSAEDSTVNFRLLDAGTVIRKEILHDRYKLKKPKCREHRDYDLKNLSFKGEPFWRMVCDSETILNCDMSCTTTGAMDCNHETAAYGQTFWIFFFVFLLANIALAPTLSLNDAIGYDILGDKSHRWGKQRLWGTIGFACFAIASTLIMDSLSKSNKTIDYNISFYIFGGLMLVCVIVAGFLKVNPDLVCSKMFRDVGKLVTQVKIAAFLLTILMFGLYGGVIEAFLFWYLRDLQLKHSGHVNGNAIIMGLSLMLNCLAEAPFLFMSGHIMKRIGQLPCIYLAFAAYAVRFIGYSFLVNPWYILFLEPLHGLTFGLLWAAATSYTNKISPPGTSATTQGLISGLHFGFGKLWKCKMKTLSKTLIILLAESWWKPTILVRSFLNMKSLTKLYRGPCHKCCQIFNSGCRFAAAYTCVL